MPYVGVTPLWSGTVKQRYSRGLKTGRETGEGGGEKEAGKMKIKKKKRLKKRSQSVCITTYSLTNTVAF